MTNSSEYTPRKSGPGVIRQWSLCDHQSPDRGPTHDKELPVGRHPLQLYSLGTPNGVKITILLEELLAMDRAARNMTLG